ncbi:MAG: ribosome assembly factor SBDS [Candidatus Nanoarchaeia archaeon]
METIARKTKEGKHFEILVDLDEALKVRKGEGNINAAVLTEAIFHNLKSGEHASTDDLEKAFNTSDVMEVAEKIIKQGEVVLPTEYQHKKQEQKYKQVVDYLVKNAVSPEGRPYTADRIMNALKEANIQVKNKPIEDQIGEIQTDLEKILPIKMEMKKIKITIPAQYTGKAYSVVNKFKEKEEWHANGDLEVVVNVPAGLIMDFYDNLNGVTHGAALTEEINEH